MRDLWSRTSWKTRRGFQAKMCHIPYSEEFVIVDHEEAETNEDAWLGARREAEKRQEREAELAQECGTVEHLLAWAGSNWKSLNSTEDPWR